MNDESETKWVRSRLPSGDVPDLNRRRGWIKRTLLETFRDWWEFNLLETEAVPLYPTKVSNQLTQHGRLDRNKAQEDPLHAFRKVSNVCSLRIVAEIST